MIEANRIIMDAIGRVAASREPEYGTDQNDIAGLVIDTLINATVFAGRDGGIYTERGITAQYAALECDICAAPAMVRLTHPTCKGDSGRYCCQCWQEKAEVISGLNSYRIHVIITA